jgi:hypothetical protein
MTTDQTAQLQLLMARISFHRKMSEVYARFFNDDQLTDLNVEGVLHPSDALPYSSFHQVLQTFAEYHIATALRLSEELERKRQKFTIENNQGAQSAGL